FPAGGRGTAIGPPPGRPPPPRPRPPKVYEKLRVAVRALGRSRPVSTNVWSVVRVVGRYSSNGSVTLMFSDARPSSSRWRTPRRVMNVDERRPCGRSRAGLYVIDAWTLSVRETRPFRLVWSDH